MLHRNSAGVAAVLAVLATGCSKQQPAGNYVARVGTATLSEAELSTLRGAQAEHLARQYVSTWVTSELLFQEAVRKGFAQSAEVLQQLEETKKQLAIAAFLDQEIYGDDTTRMDDALLLEEFTTHRETYRLREDIVRMSFAIFDERDAANAFRSRILRGASWGNALQAIRDGADLRDHLLRASTADYFSQATLYPEELWKIARTLSKEDVSYVVKTNAGHCVAIVHDTRKQGDLPDFEFARDEVQQRILVRRRNARYAELLEQLRSKYEVEVRLPASDTSGERVYE